jgi:peptidoglycan/LPS O-acetylase OafA/YrhL
MELDRMGETRMVENQSAESRSRLSAIDQWRGVSVLLVIVHHLVIFRFVHQLNVEYRLSDLVHHPALINLPDAARRMFYLWAHGIGPLGVQIFFVISGYIITRLLIREREKTGEVCLKCFYIRRAFRILPALIFFVFMMWTLSLTGAIVISPVNVGSVATFACNTSLVDCGYYFGHFWSLGVEEQFYILWPLLFVLFVAFRGTSLIWVILSACMIVSVIPRFRSLGFINNGLSFACIAAGAAYALNERFRAWLSVTNRLPSSLLPVTLVVGLTLLKALAVKLWVITTIATPFLIVAVVLPRANAAKSRNQGYVSRWLNRVGLMSYSLYLWHYVFIWEPEHYSSTAFWVASIPLALGLAWLSAHYIEPFFIAIGRKLSSNANLASPVQPALDSHAPGGELGAMTASAEKVAP